MRLSEVSEQNRKVSICIPIYNGEKYLAETIESAMNQTYQNIEIVLLNNHSSDGTEKIISEHAAKDSRIVCFSNDATLPMGDNWNKCVSHATGDYIVVLSADDLMLPEFVEQGVRCLNSSDADIFTAEHLILRDGATRPRRVTVSEGFYRDFTRLILLKNPFSINFTMFRRETIEKLSDGGKFFKEYWACDYDMWINASVKINVFFSSRVLGKYRVHTSNLSNDRSKMYNETMTVLRENRQLLTATCPLTYYFTLLRVSLRFHVRNLIG